MDIAASMASVALKVSAVVGAGYWDAVARWPGTPVMDGGSIVTPGEPVDKTCSVQVDAVTEAMRNEAGFTDRDMRLLVLASTLDGPLDSSARIDVLAGPHQGTWMLATCQRDPAGVYWDCRGRIEAQDAVDG